MPDKAISDYLGDPTAVKGLTVSDSDSDSAEPVSLRLWASSGAVAMKDANGNAVAGSGTRAISLSGAASQLNPELATLAYTGSSVGTAALSIKASDAAGLAATQTEKCRLDPTYRLFRVGVLIKASNRVENHGASIGSRTVLRRPDKSITRHNTVGPAGRADPKSSLTGLSRCGIQGPRTCALWKR